MSFSTGEKVVLGAGVVLFVVLCIAIVYGIGGLIFAGLWNWLMPSLWPAAPHLTWFQGVAASWLIGIAQTIFGGGIKFNKKDFE